MARTTKSDMHPREMVLRLLRKSREPLTAYGLLDKLHEKGIKSPPIIYRALADLEKQGAVHKIHSVGAYVACNCHTDHTHSLSVLTICKGCKRVTELHDHAVIDHLVKLRTLDVALAEEAMVELPVVCEECRVARPTKKNSPK